jgi:outer membrane receptor protein involved in Fe transport
VAVKSKMQRHPIPLAPGNRGKGTQIRFDLINLFDNQYQIRDGVGAPQFGQRRTFLVTLAQKF